MAFDVDKLGFGYVSHLFKDEVLIILLSFVEDVKKPDIKDVFIALQTLYIEAEIALFGLCQGLDDGK
jgi:hypothetical protein